MEKKDDIVSLSDKIYTECEAEVEKYKNRINMDKNIKNQSEIPCIL